MDGLEQRRNFGLKDVVAGGGYNQAPAGVPAPITFSLMNPTASGLIPPT